MMNNYRVPELGTNFTVAGWGETLTYYSSKRLKKVVVPFVSRRVCKKLFYKKYETFIPTTNICAGGELGKDSCYGDSGGPLMRKIRNYWVLEGIISYGDTDECATEMPTVHAYVHKYSDWIKENVQRKEQFIMDESDELVLSHFNANGLRTLWSEILDD